MAGAGRPLPGSEGLVRLVRPVASPGAAGQHRQSEAHPDRRLHLRKARRPGLIAELGGELAPVRAAEVGEVQREVPGVAVAAPQGVPLVVDVRRLRRRLHHVAEPVLHRAAVGVRLAGRRPRRGVERLLDLAGEAGEAQRPLHHLREVGGPRPALGADVAVEPAGGVHPGIQRGQECAHALDLDHPLGPLEDRRHELDRLVGDQVGVEAGIALGLPPGESLVVHVVAAVVAAAVQPGAGRGADAHEALDLDPEGDQGGGGVDGLHLRLLFPSGPGPSLQRI